MILDNSAHSAHAGAPVASGTTTRAELFVQDPIIHPAVSTLEELHEADFKSVLFV